MESQERVVAVTGLYAAWRESNGWCEIGVGRHGESRGTLRSIFAPQSSGVSEEVADLSLGNLLRRRVAGQTTDLLATTASERLGVTFASSKGFACWNAVEDKSDWLPAGSSCDRPAWALAKLLGARGPVLSPVAACATGSHSIALAALQIENGYADAMIAGALEFPVPPLVMAGYASLGALSKSGIMRPFDRHRDGFVPNSGTGWLILENAERARARGATIHGYLTGWSLRADATSMTGMCPDGSTIARAIDDALRRASNPSIGYINAHGTATALNDSIETRGIKSVFGNGVPVSSTKSRTGHLLGAAGAVEAVLSVRALQEAYLPPTLNLQEPDDNCDLDCIVGAGREQQSEAALSLSYGFGGHLGALVFERNTDSLH